MIKRRLKAAWLAFLNPDDLLPGNEKEMRSLVKEIYDWTLYKKTGWAKRANKALNS